MRDPCQPPRLGSVTCRDPKAFLVLVAESQSARPPAYSGDSERSLCFFLCLFLLYAGSLTNLVHQSPGIIDDNQIIFSRHEHLFDRVAHEQEFWSFLFFIFFIIFWHYFFVAHG